MTFSFAPSVFKPHRASITGGLPRVLIDGYFYDKAYGFGRYVRELVHALDGTTTNFELVLVLPEGAWHPALDRVGKARIVRRKRRLFPVWEQVIVPAVARDERCRLVHFPYQSTALLWPRAATVATIHDLMFLRPNATAQTRFDRVAHLYRRLLFSVQTRHAARLVAVSDATRRELHAEVRAPSVTIENVCEEFVSRHESTPAASEEGRFFLHRGDLSPHKNTRRTVGAFARVRASAPDARLLVYGANEASLLAALPSDGVVLLGKVSDARLASLYKSASAVVTASLEEGFGLSIIEAFGLGAAVITSDRAPMKDVAGRGALLVDPERPEEIATAMLRILCEPETRERLLAEGRRRYETYSSARAVAALTQLYGDALAIN
jgi:glycosyltransferase involved in cell wall biosynthesis